MSENPEPRIAWPKKIEYAVLTILGVAATLIMFGNAVSRYVFGKTYVWAEEVIRMIFVCGMFIAITTAFFRNEHIGFDNFSKKKGPLNLVYRLTYSLCLIAVGGILAVYGYRYNALTGSVPLAATNLPAAIFMWPGIIAGTTWALLGIWRLIRIFIGRSEGKVT